MQGQALQATNHQYGRAGLHHPGAGPFSRHHGDHGSTGHSDDDGLDVVGIDDPLAHHHRLFSGKAFMINVAQCCQKLKGRRSFRRDLVFKREN